ncbi:MAG TPA: hypothetical protein VFK80_03150 [Limnochordia bacterium]|nr:hypothetical protein [Limnochordia bacterium]
MASRALAFSDPEVIRLANAAFVPVADNVSHLQRQKDAEGEFFRKVAEQGHYAGRTIPTDTRQGIYAFTTDGDLLASINTRTADRMLEMMQRALAAWEARGQRQGSAVPNEFMADRRFDHEPPAGGLILNVYSRDLPRDEPLDAADWRARAHNRDHAWLTAEELSRLAPRDPAVGRRYPLDPAVLRRLVLFHLIDNVRGEPPMWKAANVARAQVELVVEAVSATEVRLALTGEVRLEESGVWPIGSEGAPTARQRGYHASLTGRVVWNRALGRPSRFDLVAAGARWGATQYNARQDDLGPAPLGIAFELAGDAPADRTPPQGIYAGYFG